MMIIVIALIVAYVMRWAMPLQRGSSKKVI